jgi:hypothetical protein
MACPAMFRTFGRACTIFSSPLPIRKVFMRLSNDLTIVCMISRLLTVVFDRLSCGSASLSCVTVDLINYLCTIGIVASIGDMVVQGCPNVFVRFSCIGNIKSLACPPRITQIFLTNIVMYLKLLQEQNEITQSQDLSPIGDIRFFSVF